jgi:hypothetical protein
MNEMMGSPKVKTRSYPDNVVSTSLNELFNAAHVSQGTFSNGSYTYGVTGEQIVYTTKRKNMRAKSNYCYHLKERFFYPGGTDVLSLSNNSPAGWTTDYRGHHANACNARATIVNAANTALVNTRGGVLGAYGQAWINDFFSRVQPDLTTVSVPNFLLDIKELTRLYELWVDRSARFPRYIKNVKHATKKDVVNSIPDKFVAYKFGWKPTVADLTDMITATIGLRKKIAEFQDKLGGLYQRNSSVIHGLPTSAAGTTVYPSGGHSCTWTANCQRKVEASVTYAAMPIAAIHSLDLVLRGLLDSMGFELNPRIIWDAIPFSFVVDWFFDVGSFLGRFKIDTLNLPIVLVDSFVSYKEINNIQWRWIRANDGTYTTRPTSAGACNVSNFFHRMPIYPDYTSLSGLGWKMPTLNQAALGVSLVSLLGGARSRI